MPQLLVDVNLSPSWIGYLREHGIEAVHWASVGSCKATDREIMLYARTQGLVVFTNDLDFSALLAEERAAQPSVIQVRGQGVLPTQIGQAVVQSVRAFEEHLESGALVTIDLQKSRVRILPL